MSTSFSRADRIASEMRREIASLLHRELKDPRIDPLIGVSEVRVSGDLSIAKIYVSLDKDDAVVKETMAALNRAKGFIRTRLSDSLRLRKTPELVFIYDDTLRRGNRLTGLIDEALARDSLSRDTEEE